MAFTPVELEKDGHRVTAYSPADVTNLRFAHGYTLVKKRKAAPKPVGKTEETT